MTKDDAITSSPIVRRVPIFDLVRWWPYTMGPQLHPLTLMSPLRSCSLMTNDNATTSSPVAPSRLLMTNDNGTYKFRCSPSWPHDRFCSLMTNDNAITSSPVVPLIPITDLVCWWPMTTRPQLKLLALVSQSLILFVDDQWQCAQNLTCWPTRLHLSSCSLMTNDNVTTTSGVGSCVPIFDLLRWWPMTMWPQLQLLVLVSQSLILSVDDQWQCDHNFFCWNLRPHVRFFSLMTNDHVTTTYSLRHCDNDNATSNSHVVSRVLILDFVRWWTMTIWPQLYLSAPASPS